MKHQFEQKVKSYLEAYDMIKRGDTVYAAVSGGADSVCLFLVLKELEARMGFELRAIHVEHGIRGESSKADEAFVKELCASYEVPIACAQADVPARSAERGESIEEAARAARYEAFETLSGSGAKVALAHHTMDQAETVLFHLVRGSGIDGLSGMAPVRGRYIRPLLWASRDDIHSYLSERGQTYRTDATNEDDAYSRNFLRIHVMPLLTQVNGSAADHISRTAMFLKETRDYFEGQSEVFLKKHAKSEEACIRIPVSALCKLKNPLRRHVLYAALCKAAGRKKDLTYAHVESIDKVLLARTGAGIDLPYDLRCEKEYTELIIYRKLHEKAHGDEGVLVLPGDFRQSAVYGDCTFSFLPRESVSDEEIHRDNPCTKYIDCDKIKQELRLRTPREGDYLIIDANEHKKKLNRYFIDHKVPRLQREKQIVLADGDCIVWVAGERLSEAYKVGPASKRILEISLVYQIAPDGTFRDNE